MAVRGCFFFGPEKDEVVVVDIGEGFYGLSICYVIYASSYILGSWRSCSVDT